MELHLLTGYQGFYGQARKPWVSIDTALFVRHLEAKGIKVIQADWKGLASGNWQPQDATILYSFSQLAHIRGWLKDQLTNLAISNRLIPSLPLLLCHENKGFSWLHQQSLGITEPRAWYLCHPDDIPADLPYPIVLKTISGTNARGVWLCKDRTELLGKVASLAPKLTVWDTLDHFRRVHFRKGRSYEGYRQGSRSACLSGGRSTFARAEAMRAIRISSLRAMPLPGWNTGVPEPPFYCKNISPGWIATTALLPSEQDFT